MAAKTPTFFDPNQRLLEGLKKQLNDSKCQVPTDSVMQAFVHAGKHGINLFDDVGISGCLANHSASDWCAIGLSPFIKITKKGKLYQLLPPNHNVLNQIFEYLHDSRPGMPLLTEDDFIAAGKYSDLAKISFLASFKNLRTKYKEALNEIHASISEQAKSINIKAITSLSPEISSSDIFDISDYLSVEKLKEDDPAGAIETLRAFGRHQISSFFMCAFKLIEEGLINIGALEKIINQQLGAEKDLDLPTLITSLRYTNLSLNSCPDSAVWLCGYHHGLRLSCAARTSQDDNIISAFLEFESSVERQKDKYISVMGGDNYNDILTHTSKTLDQIQPKILHHMQKLAASQSNKTLLGIKQRYGIADDFRYSSFIFKRYKECIELTGVGINTPFPSDDLFIIDMEILGEALRNELAECILRKSSSLGPNYIVENPSFLRIVQIYAGDQEWSLDRFVELATMYKHPKYQATAVRMLEIPRSEYHKLSSMGRNNVLRDEMGL